MLRLRPAKADEYDQVIDFLSRQFNCAPEAFANMSHIYAPLSSVMRQTNLAIRDGRIVGVYGIFPRRLRVGSAELSAAGIGGVCTHRAHRGQGIMTFMIRAGDQIMRRAGMDVAGLGGDRFRYRTFGWDGGGRLYRFVLTQRSLRCSGVAPGRARVCQPQRDLPRVRRAHDALQYRLARPKAYFQRVIGRPGRDLVVSDQPGRFAYAFVERPCRLVEVAGHPDGLGAIAWHLIKRRHAQQVEVHIGPEDSDLFRWLVACGAESRSHVSASWQIRILDLFSTLIKLLPEIRRRAPRGLPEGRITLTMRDSDQTATLRFGRRFAVERWCSRTRLTLSDAEMTRLILGPFPLAESFDLPGRLADLNVLLPIPWHWPILDRV